MTRKRVPAWFWIVAILLILWGLMGVGAFYMSLSDSVRAQMDAYDRALYESWPAWYMPVYGIAIWSGLIGSVLLILRRTWARPAYIVSLVAVVVMFAWTFLATDLIAHKGVVVAFAFPILIVLICLFQIWFAAHGRRRGWIG